MYPICQCCFRLISNLGLRRSLSLLLHGNRSRRDSFTVARIAYPELDQITGLKPAVYAQIEQREIAKIFP
jgi:hypothetical protein